VLAKVEAGKDKEVLKEVKKMSGVKQATPTYGVYDPHVETSFDTIEELDRFIFEIFEAIRKSSRNKGDSNPDRFQRNMNDQDGLQGSLLYQCDAVASSRFLDRQSQRGCERNEASP
jgi:DNA-binding Lrp family transcriptional regulator